MEVRNIGFGKPKPNHQCKLYSYANGSMYDLETRSKEVAPNIGRYKKLSKNEMLDTATNKIIPFNSNAPKNRRNFIKTFKQAYRVIMENFSENGNGNGTGILIKLKYNHKPTNIYEDFKNCYRKLQRRAKQSLIYIMVLQYQENGLPCLEVWIKTADNTKINLTQDMVEDSWKLGDVELIELTLQNIQGLAQYFLSMEHTDFEKFPPYAKLYHTSRNVKKVVAEIVSYEEAEKRVKGMEQTFARTKALVDRVDGKEVLYQEITFETFVTPRNETDITEKS